ncbi:ribose-phosphate pyrophosphokinase [bacterium]|jgi:ribose-phosphate pyrophosphokinase|nr:ribose-phosphate pyrophosphokinase [bacterium]MBP9092653.1 ribose-phosphate pyrophosphokinase [bacterium]MBP9807573.1 ribose-phosphate pyrophosphokinase [bacterium]MDP3510123.1 ribose-phosphate pyrophosphokinase [Candidatus Melainabacteria bacterium]
MVAQMPARQTSLPGVKPELKILAGTANPELAKEVADHLGLPLTPIKIKPFSDGEIYVQLQESVRGMDCFIIQPTCTPVNENLMELLILIDALKRASAGRITVVMPYYGYGRQDRKAAGREAITAKLIADLLTTAGAQRVVALDLHAPQIMGFFNILVDHLYASPVLLKYVRDLNLSDMVLVSPDVGGVSRTRAFAKKLDDAPIAIIDKRRTKHNVAEVMSVVGDVRGRTAIMVDDMVDTAGTLVKGAELLIKEGATRVFACATHAVLSGPANERLEESPIEQLIVTNSIPHDMTHMSKKIVALSVAELLGEAIWRIHDDSSVSEMFE